MHIKSNFLKKFNYASGFGEIKKVLSLRKSWEQEVFWDWNWDFIRSFEPEPKKSHCYKKECITLKYTVLYWIVLCCTVMYHIVMGNIVIYCIIL